MMLRIVIGLVLLAALQARAQDAPVARDPFVDPRAALEDGYELPRGLAGLRVSELRLTGVSRLGSQDVALVLGSDGIGYVLRAGDRLWDGQVLEVDFQTRSVLFAERVPDGDPQTFERELSLRVER